MKDFKFDWENVVGHATKIEQLKKIIAEEKFPHAIIFSGIEGIGKRKIAEIVAAVLLCENSVDGSACGECTSCRLSAAGSHPDFYIVEPDLTKATRNIKIGQIRDLQAEAALRPVQSDRRIVLIDGAEFMNSAAANCLLKTLEEPPSRTIFILLTANRAGLLLTLRSRCRTFNFDKLKTEEVRAVLLSRGVESEKAEKISIIADGSLGRALNLSENGGYEMRESALDLIERIALEDVTNEDIFTKGIQIAEWSREQFSDFVIYTQKILRDIFLQGKVELYNPDFSERLKVIKIPEKRLSEMIKVGVETRRRLKSNASLRLLAEAYFMRLRKIFSD